MASVPFDHKRHILTGRSCSDCHHKSMDSCGSCHTLTGARAGKFVTLAEAYHSSGTPRSCVGCHEREQQKPDCAGCHQLRQTRLSASSCKTCHTGTLQSLEEAKTLPDPDKLFPENMKDEFEITVLTNEYGAARVAHAAMAEKLTAISNGSRLATYFHSSETTICAGCHHKGPAGTNGKVPPCATCHSAHAQPSGKVPTLLGAYHQACLGCHRDMARPEKKTPRSCTGCHKQAGTMTGTAAPEGEDQDDQEAPYQPVVVASNTNPPSRAIFLTIPDALEPLKRAPVRFNHDRHTAALKDRDCSACHPKEDGQFEFTFPKAPGGRSATALMDAYHSACIECHKQRAVERRPGGPVTCGECHDAKKAFQPAEYRPALPDTDAAFKEIRHKDCATCHRSGVAPPHAAPALNLKQFRALEKRRVEVAWPPVTFDYVTHNKHVNALDKKCDLCHRPELKPKFAPKVKDLFIKHRVGDASQSCAKCHSYNGEIPDAKCESCHLIVRNRRVAATGYHGTFRENCVHCHKEHLAPSQPIVPFDAKKFDHNLAAYKCEGKHARLECDECHRKKRTKDTPGYYYIGLPYQLCTDCHRDPHGRQFAAACSKCHSPAGWRGKDLTFSHATDSSYPLSGKHATVDCAKCHKPKWPWSPLGSAAFKGLTTECAGCHQDPHRKQFRTPCTACHTAAGWKGKDLLFDHNRDSAYKLADKHATTDCAKCHKPARLGASLATATFKGLSAECASCHKDPHRGQFTGTCTRCHADSKTWTIDKKAFDHTRQTRFPLVGKHAAVDCVKCHVPNAPGASLGTAAFRGLAVACAPCHKVKHPDSYGPACVTCHPLDAWPAKMKGVEHLAKRDLTGKHQTVPCSACHNEKRMVAIKKFGTHLYSCNNCHRIDDPHKGTLGTDCAKCHTQAGWKGPNLRFDHDTMTSYILTREHRKVACAKCHQPGQWKPVNRTCEGCHPKMLETIRLPVPTNSLPPRSPPSRLP